MRKIAVLSSFMEEHHIEKIRTLAAEYGFAVDFYPDDRLDMTKADQYEILYGMPGPSLLKHMTGLQWFCTPSAGVEPYTPDEIYPHEGVLLTNSAGAYGITISEHILMVTLMLLRQMPAFQQVVADRGWVRQMPMRSICGSTITVLGTGDIGTNFARRAKALGARTVYGVRRTKKAGDGAFDAMYGMDELNSILPQTDILVMALPGTPETAGTLSRERIALLPRHAVVVNVGRGSAIDQEALMDALNSESIAGAALDVMVPEPLPADHPLWEAKNILITPHISGNMSLGITRDLDVDLFCTDLANYANRRPLQQLVDRKLGY